MLTKLQAQPGDIKHTAERFSLVRPSQREAGRDILLNSFRGFLASQVQTPDHRRRLLVTEHTSVDADVVRRLSKARIPQAPLLGSSEHLAYFEILNGSKLLSREALRDRQSSATYIGDNEIYNNVGRLYGAAWRATRRLFLSDDPADRISDHIAIVNFSEAETSNIYLCPPYGDSQDIPDAEAARQAFVGAIQAENLDPDGNLALAAIDGFDDVMRLGWR